MFSGSICRPIDILVSSWNIACLPCDQGILADVCIHILLSAAFDWTSYDPGSLLSAARFLLTHHSVRDRYTHTFFHTLDVRIQRCHAVNLQHALVSCELTSWRHDKTRTTNHHPLIHFTSRYAHKDVLTMMCSRVAHKGGVSIRCGAARIDG